jgi:hypothetical protein
MPEPMGVARSTRLFVAVNDLVAAIFKLLGSGEAVQKDCAEEVKGERVLGNVT